MYGLITFLVCLLYNLIHQSIFQTDKPNWVFWKWILSTLILILCIAIANYIYFMYSVGNYSFNIKALGLIVFNTVLLGLFPLVFLGFVQLNRSRNKNNKIAGSIQLGNRKNINEQNNIQLGETAFNISEILFLEAMQNYVLIHSTIKKPITIRSTLTKLENELAKHQIIRCHRSYLVNINAIEAVSGNAQGLKLAIKNNSAIVPVSRKYIAIIKSILD